MGRKTKTPETPPETVADTVDSSGLIPRQIARVSKLNTLLGSLDKDLTRAPAADQGAEPTWGDKTREATGQIMAWLQHLTAALNEAPEGYEHPRRPRSAAAQAVASGIGEGSKVQIKEKFRDQYKYHLDGIEFGTTALGTVRKIFADNPKKLEASVEFRTGENAVRVMIGVGRLAEVENTAPVA